MLCDQTGSRKFNHQAAVLDLRLRVWLHCIHATSTELLDPENIIIKRGCSRWTLVPVSCTSWDISTAGLRPPSWISDFRFGRTALRLLWLSCQYPRIWVLTLEFCSYPNYKLRSKYFPFRGRHLGLPTSGLVGQQSDYLLWLAGPQKYGVSLWNFVPVSSTSWDVSTAGLGPPCWISDFQFGRTASRLLPLSCWTPKTWGGRWNFVPISFASWDTRGWQPPFSSNVRR